MLRTRFPCAGACERLGQSKTVGPRSTEGSLPPSPPVPHLRAQNLSFCRRLLGVQQDLQQVGSELGGGPLLTGTDASWRPEAQ